MLDSIPDIACRAADDAPRDRMNQTVNRSPGSHLAVELPGAPAPARRMGHQWMVAAVLLLVTVLTAALTSVRLDGRQETPPDVAAAAPAAPVTSAPPVEQHQESTSRPAAAKARWRPNAGLSWQWQLTGTVDQSVDAAVYDIDMFENDAAVVAELHAAGRKVICYIDVGGWEDYRSDAAQFPASVKGKTIAGWPSERWLDIRQLDVLRPIMAARLDLCAERGYDGVEPDLMDAASADTGFPLTAADQLRYNLMIADLGHERGLAVGLKNDLTQIPQLVSHFEFAVNEQCVEYSECALAVPFIVAGKPVFHAEYDVPTATFCPQTTRLGFSSIRKKLDLGAWRETCRPTANTS